jgi:formamidopyrimidine-DNA glycosylase
MLDLLGGERVQASSPQLRFAAGANLLDDAVVRAAEAHGKHLFLGFAARPGAPADRWLHVHLGLYGGWTVQPHGPGQPPAPPRGAVRLRLTGPTGTADLRGPTTCEVLGPPEKQAVHDRLGADPLRSDADPAAAWHRIQRSRSPVGALLMRQDLVAGVGNVYRAEVLFRAGLDPHRPGREVTADQWQALWSDLARLLRAGVRAGRIVTTRPQDRPRAGGRVRREDAHYVYRRTGLPCRVCGTVVLAEPFAARTLYRCPGCQPA